MTSVLRHETENLTPTASATMGWCAPEAENQGAAGCPSHDTRPAQGSFLSALSCMFPWGIMSSSLSLLDTRLLPVPGIQEELPAHEFRMPCVSLALLNHRAHPMQSLWPQKERP